MVTTLLSPLNVRSPELPCIAIEERRRSTKERVARWGREYRPSRKENDDDRNEEISTWRDGFLCFVWKQPQGWRTVASNQTEYCVLTYVASVFSWIPQERYRIDVQLQEKRNLILIRTMKHRRKKYTIWLVDRISFSLNRTSSIERVTSNSSLIFFFFSYFDSMSIICRILNFISTQKLNKTFSRSNSRSSRAVPEWRFIELNFVTNRDPGAPKNHCNYVSACPRNIYHFFSTEPSRS